MRGPAGAPGGRVGVYLCTCGGAFAGRIDPERLEEAVRALVGDGYVVTHPQACSPGGKDDLAADIAVRRPGRVVVAACSPREREAEFAAVAEAAGLNPFLLHPVNLREQAAWVTPDPAAALAKAVALVRAGIARVRRQEPLAPLRRPALPDALVVGAGPAGVRAALTLAAAGRRVTLVERTAAVGGVPVVLDRLFPTLECGSCAVEGPLGELLHGAHAGAIELLTLSEVEGAAGSLGAFEITVRSRPRRVDPARCLGCAACVEACPVRSPAGRKAIDFAFPGAQPAAPVVDAGACLALAGGGCAACVEACPAEPNAVDLDDAGRRRVVAAGGVVLATGNAQLPAAAVGWAPADHPDVVTDRQFHERLTGGCWSEGGIRTASGAEPREVAVVHCAGSLDPLRSRHCSGVCCRTALTVGRVVRARLPGARVTHVVRELVVPGREGARLLGEAGADAGTAFVRADGPEAVSVTAGAAGLAVQVRSADGSAHRLVPDLVVLCPALVPATGAAGLARAFDVATDEAGFLLELNRGLDPTESRVRGVYLAGGCASPTDLAGAVAAGDAAAARLIADLPPGGTVAADPARAEVRAGACTGCGLCLGICPFRAIEADPADGRAAVRELLCRGCGSCAAACPAGAIRARGYTREQVLAEIGGLLA